MAPDLLDDPDADLSSSAPTADAGEADGRKDDAPAMTYDAPETGASDPPAAPAPRDMQAEQDSEPTLQPAAGLAAESGGGGADAAEAERQKKHDAPGAAALSAAAEVPPVAEDQGEAQAESDAADIHPQPERDQVADQSADLVTGPGGVGAADAQADAQAEAQAEGQGHPAAEPLGPVEPDAPEEAVSGQAEAEAHESEPVPEPSAEEPAGDDGNRASIRQAQAEGQGHPAAELLGPVEPDALEEAASEQAVAEAQESEPLVADALEEEAASDQAGAEPQKPEHVPEGLAEESASEQPPSAGDDGDRVPTRQAQAEGQERPAAEPLGPVEPDAPEEAASGQAEAEAHESEPVPEPSAEEPAGDDEDRVAIRKAQAEGQGHPAAEPLGPAKPDALEEAASEQAVAQAQVSEPPVADALEEAASEQAVAEGPEEREHVPERSAEEPTSDQPPAGGHDEDRVPTRQGQVEQKEAATLQAPTGEETATPLETQTVAQEPLPEEDDRAVSDAAAQGVLIPPEVPPLGAPQQPAATGSTAALDAAVGELPAAPTLAVAGEPTEGRARPDSPASVSHGAIELSTGGLENRADIQQTEEQHPEPSSTHQPDLPAIDETSFISEEPRAEEILDRASDEGTVTAALPSQAGAVASPQKPSKLKQPSPPVVSGQKGQGKGSRPGPKDDLAERPGWGVSQGNKGKKPRPEVSVPKPRAARRSSTLASRPAEGRSEPPGGAQLTKQPAPLLGPGMGDGLGTKRPAGDATDLSAEDQLALEQKARAGLEDMLLRIERHFKAEQAARKRAEEELEEARRSEAAARAELEAERRRWQSEAAHMEQEKVDLAAGVNEMEEARRHLQGEAESLRQQATEATQLLQGAEDRGRQAEAMQRHAVESEYQQRIQLLQAELNGVRSELMQRTAALQDELQRWRRHAENSAAAVMEAKAEVLDRKRELDVAKDKMDSIVDKLMYTREKGIELTSAIDQQLHRGQPPAWVMQGLLPGGPSHMRPVPQGPGGLPMLMPPPPMPMPPGGMPMPLSLPTMPSPLMHPAPRARETRRAGRPTDESPKRAQQHDRRQPQWDSGSPAKDYAPPDERGSHQGREPSHVSLPPIDGRSPPKAKPGAKKAKAKPVGDRWAEAQRENARISYAAARYG